MAQRLFRLCILIFRAFIPMWQPIFQTDMTKATEFRSKELTMLMTTAFRLSLLWIVASKRTIKLNIPTRKTSILSLLITTYPMIKFRMLWLCLTPSETIANILIKNFVAAELGLKLFRLWVKKEGKLLKN